MTSPTIGATDFARGRHTAEGNYSHFEGSWRELCALVAAHFHEAVAGNRDGVVLVPVPADRFLSSVVAVTESTELSADFYRRTDDEDRYLRVLANQPKDRARFVEIVLYRSDVLGDDAPADGSAWGVVSVNASPTDAATPMDPLSMARNFLELPGGTKCDYSAEEFARAIVWHASHCHRKA